MSHYEYLQGLIDRGGIVTIPDGEYSVDKTLEVGDDTRIVCSPKAYIRLADHANCPLLTTKFKGTDHPTKNVSVIGGTWDGNNVGQERDAYTHPHYRWGQCLAFSCTEDLTLEGLTVKDPNSFAITLTDTTRFTVRDIRFDCNCKTGNQDGVHVNGFAKDGYICNIRGNTNDDMIALNSDEGITVSPFNDIENIVIDGVYGSDYGWTAVRLLSRDAHLKNITIRNIFGAYRYNAVSFTHWSGEPVNMGHMDNIIIENVFATSCRKTGTGHGGLIWFQSNMSDIGTVIIRNMIRREADDMHNSTCTMSIGHDVNIRRMILENVYQTVTDDKPLIAAMKGAHVDHLTVNGEEKKVEDYIAEERIMESLMTIYD